MHPHPKKIFILLLLGVASVSCGSETQKSSEVSGVVPAPQSSSSSVISSQSVSSAQPTGPEPRQISSSSGSSGSSFPYSLYQNAILSSALPQTASSSGSWLSILRPSQGGRRASLTSRLRNIMNAIFRREQSNSPYMAQGSSLSYSLRQPPLGFGGFGSGLSSGLGSGFGSGFGSGVGSGLGSQNLFASASGYQPIVLPSGVSGLSGLTAGQLGQAAGSSRWANSNNYKTWANSNDDSLYDSSSPSLQNTYSLSSLVNSPSSNYGWSSTGSGSPGQSASSYPASAYASNSYGSSGSGSSGSYQSSVASPQTYQVASSNYSPSSSSYSSGSYPSNSQYQRSSSSSSFKPIVSSQGSYSSGLVGSASVPSATYSSSVSSSNSIKSNISPVVSSVSNSGVASVGSSSNSYSAQQ